MKIALVMNDNSYCGREYLSALRESGIKVDTIVIGRHPEVNESEEYRCGGLWTPPPQIALLKEEDVNRFSSLNDNKLKTFLNIRKYDIGIQGGTGIIRYDIFGSFRLGMLNFHPGDLPLYRGCSAPEWQLYEGNPVICTCHLIDEGIDSGAIVRKRKIFQMGEGSYHEMRSLIYPRAAQFMVDVLKNINESDMINATKQHEEEACYRKYIGEAKIAELKIRMES